MRSNLRRAAVLLALACLAAALTACEDSDPIAPVDGVMALTVSPSVITIDPDAGETEGSTTVLAAVFDAEGSPLSGIAVLFTTEAGELDSGTETVETDENGFATTTLTVTSTAPGTFTVRAQSSMVVAEAQVDVEVLEANEQPRAAIIDVPKGQQEAGKSVLFDGSASTDSDGEITCFQWEIVSTYPGASEVIQGASASALQRTYDREQDLSVVLRVSDRADAGSVCFPTGPKVPLELFSPKVATLAYKINCANTPPVAKAGPDQLVTLVGAEVPVTLDGSLSSDAETPRDQLKFSWSCGNGTYGFPPGMNSFCKYTAPGTYTLTLTVQDGGDSSGNCVKEGSDTATITVVRLAG